MALFICPNCEQHSEIKGEENDRYHICPHCGERFSIDTEANIIIDE